MWSSIDTESKSQRAPHSGTVTTDLVLITLGAVSITQNPETQLARRHPLSSFSELFT